MFAYTLSAFMRSRPHVALVAAAALAGCGEEALPEEPPVAVAYAEACRVENHERIVQIEGYLDLFPRLFSCRPHDREGVELACQVELMPARTTPHATVEERAALLTTFIIKGERPNQVRAQGYGFGAPLQVFAADSAEVDPGDRVRLTGRYYAAPDIFNPDSLTCQLQDVRRIEVVQRPALTWADSMATEREATRAQIDSMQTVLDSLERSHAAPTP